MSRTFRSIGASLGFVVLMLALGCGNDAAPREASEEFNPLFEKNSTGMSAEDAERERSDRLAEKAIEQGFQMRLEASSTPDERLSLTLESACNFKLTENGSFSSFYHTLFSNAWDENWYVRPDNPWPHRLIDGMTKFCPDQVIPIDYYSQQG